MCKGKRVVNLHKTYLVYHEGRGGQAVLCTFRVRVGKRWMHSVQIWSVPTSPWEPWPRRDHQGLYRFHSSSSTRTMAIYTDRRRSSTRRALFSTLSFLAYHWGNAWLCSTCTMYMVFLFESGSRHYDFNDWISVRWIGCFTSQTTIFQLHMWRHIDVTIGYLLLPSRDIWLK